jgi:hypothetical protein
MTVGWRDVDPTWLQDIAFLRLFHAHVGAMAEDIGHKASMSRVEVLNDYDRRAEVLGQPGQDLP